jgi:hypothetical protein
MIQMRDVAPGEAPNPGPDGRLQWGIFLGAARMGNEKGRPMPERPYRPALSNNLPIFSGTSL